MPGKSHTGDLRDLVTSVHVVCVQVLFFLLNSLGWYCLIKLHMCKVYNSVIHHLHIVYRFQSVAWSRLKTTPVQWKVSLSLFKSLWIQTCRMLPSPGSVWNWTTSRFMLWYFAPQGTCWFYLPCVSCVRFHSQQARDNENSDFIEYPRTSPSGRGIDRGRVNENGQ